MKTQDSDEPQDEPRADSVDLPTWESEFHRLLELEPGERARELSLLAQTDSRAHTELSSLLSALEGAPECFLGDQADLDERLVGQSIGGFELVRVLGVGGMGVVYEARQQEPRRHVALKVLRTLPGWERPLERFRFEGEAMARLSHPHIAQVFETGVARDAAGALAWIAMELVSEAQDLRAHVRERDLQVEQRLELFEQLCVAVQHAHGHGLLHRDLKPQNVLVDGEGRLRVIDFGVAASLEESGDETAVHRSLATRAGDVIGSLSHMSPEQCAGSPADIRSDVYSLGVMLFELLCGQSPFEPPPGDARHGLAEGLQWRRTVQSQAPSQVGVHLAQDLETILATATDADPTRRYATVDALLADLRRFRTHQPIQARPSGLVRRTKLFVRRNMGSILAASAVLGTLVVGVVVATQFALSAERSRGQWEREAYLANIAAAEGALEAHDAQAARNYLERAPLDLRGWEWSYLSGRLDGGRVLDRWNDVLILGGGLSASGNRVVATSTGPETARVWDALTGTVVWSWPRDSNLATTAALSPDGSQVVLGYKAGRVELWRLPVEVGEQAQLQWSLRDREVERRSACYSPDGLEVAIGDLSGEVRQYQALDGELLVARQAHADGVRALAYDPEGHWLFTGGAGADPSLCRFDRAPDRSQSNPGVAARVANASHVACLSLSQAGGWLAAGTMEGTVRLFDPHTLESAGLLRGHSGGVVSLAWSGDGRSLASGSVDNTVRLWAPKTPGAPEVLAGHPSDVRLLGFVGEDLVSADRRSLWKWDLSSRRPRELSGLPRGAADLVEVESGAWAAVSKRGESVVWGALELAAKPSIERAPQLEAVYQIEEHYCLTSDGGRLFGTDDQLRVHERSLGDGRVLRVLREDTPTRCLGLDPSETRLAVGGFPASITVLDVESGEVLSTWNWEDVHSVLALCWSATGDSLWLALSNDRLEHRDLSGRVVNRLELDWTPMDLALGDGDRLLAVGGNFGSLVVFDLESNGRMDFAGHAETVRDLEFSPDGTRLASASIDGSVRVWEPRWGAQLLDLRGHSLHAYRVRWSGDGATLASAGGDWSPETSTVRLWPAGGAPLPD